MKILRLAILKSRVRKLYKHTQYKKLAKCKKLPVMEIMNDYLYKSFDKSSSKKSKFSKLSSLELGN